jgi:hypothetical protein
LSNLGYHIDKITVRNILRRHHIDPAPKRRQTGMSWLQFLKIHWTVLTAPDFFTEGMATLAGVWISVMQLGKDFTTTCLLLAVHIPYSLRGVLLSWRPPVQCLWAGRLVRTRVRVVNENTQCVSFRPATCQPTVSRVQQEREPPAARGLRLRVVTRHYARGRRGAGSRLLTGSGVEHDGSLGRRLRRHGGSCTTSVQAAA